MNKTILESSSHLAALLILPSFHSESRESSNPAIACSLCQVANTVPEIPSTHHSFISPIIITIVKHSVTRAKQYKPYLHTSIKLI
ncbi:hypothetical protein DL95DRAFT_385924 [Leptodontidium sp. 2 PMI_412]|nr:hypothetical protein DL95DRAFT_385924 [Leptodontidium sp. 2 PMI_412]